MRIAFHSQLLLPLERQIEFCLRRLLSLLINRAENHLSLSNANKTRAILLLVSCIEPPRVHRRKACKEACRSATPSRSGEGRDQEPSGLQRAGHGANREPAQCLLRAVKATASVLSSLTHSPLLEVYSIKYTKARKPMSPDGDTAFSNTLLFS